MGTRSGFWQCGHRSGVLGVSSCWSARRMAGRLSLVYRLFFYRLLLRRSPLAFQGQKAIRQQHQRGVMVKPTPGAPLEVVQSQFLLQLLVALFHRPAALPQADGLLATGPRRQVREGKLQLAISLLLKQQPHRLRLGAVAVLPVLAGPDTEPREARRQLPLRSFPPGHLLKAPLLGQLL